MIIAIDGPSGSGKSTVARRVAAELGLRVVDTGALYRAVALAARRAELEPDAGARLGAFVPALQLELRGQGAATRLLLDGEDVSAAIRTEEVSLDASRYSAVPEVRGGLLELQRTLAHAPPGAVLEGRDIGTVVIPDATFKFFLTASLAERARRRHAELTARGEDVALEEVLAAARERDRRDEQRAAAPLRQGPDATLVDSDRLGADEVVALIVAHVRAATGRAAPLGNGKSL